MKGLVMSFVLILGLAVSAQNISAQVNPWDALAVQTQTDCAGEEVQEFSASSAFSKLIGIIIHILEGEVDEANLSKECFAEGR
jgi:hypothetical protein